MQRTVQCSARIFSSLLILFTIACGGSSDSPVPVDDGLDFELRLELTSGDTLSPIGYAYPRCPSGIDYAGGAECIEDGAAGWDNGAPGGTLNYLQTAQFILESGQTPHRLMVRDKTNQANCMVAYFQGPSTQPSDSWARFTLGFDDPSTSYTVPTGQLSVETPLHFTLVPIMTGATCADPGVDAKGDRVLAAWISVRPPQETPIANEVICNLDSSMDFSQDVVDGDCTISAPKWRMDNQFRRVLYTGTLWDMLDSAPPKVTINLADDLSLPVPINSAYTAFYLQPGTQESDCEAAVARMNAGQQPENTLCQVEVSSKGALFTQPSSAQFAINGFGRISGFDVLKDFPVNEQSFLPGGSGAIQAFQSYAEARVRSYLIGLSSNHPTTDPINDPAIRVQNATVAWTAKLGDGSVELNSEYLYVENAPLAPEPDYVQAVHLRDYKQVGSWVGQSDGPEVMGNHSLVEYSYLHVADDAIKVAAQEVDFKQITVIKGNSGGVVNLGSYGKNRGVEGAVAEQIWVPRITHNSNAGSGALALVLSRTCPFEASLTGAIVRNLYVPSLGSGGLPNAVSGLVRLGVMASACDVRPDQNEFTIGDIDFLEFEVEIQPQVSSVLYADTVENSSGQAIEIKWEKVRFYDDNQPIDPARAVVFYPDSGSTGYYICGRDAGSPNQCYSTNGQGQGNPQINLEYVAGLTSNSPEGEAVYPGGP